MLNFLQASAVTQHMFLSRTSHSASPAVVSMGTCTYNMLLSPYAPSYLLTTHHTVPYRTIPYRTISDQPPLMMSCLLLSPDTTSCHLMPPPITSFSRTAPRRHTRVPSRPSPSGNSWTPLPPTRPSMTNRTSPAARHRAARVTPRGLRVTRRSRSRRKL